MRILSHFVFPVHFISLLAFLSFYPTYRTPLVLTTSPAPTSPATLLLQAFRIATARALNALSARWWSLSPYVQPTCNVTPAACAKLCKPCVIISVLRSPIFSRLNPRSMTAHGRLDRSITAHDSASSSGASPRPKRSRDWRAPSACVNASPRARKVSSVVWWSSTVIVSFVIFPFSFFGLG